MVVGCFGGLVIVSLWWFVRLGFEWGVGWVVVFPLLDSTLCELG